jgi:putative transposase
LNLVEETRQKYRFVVYGYVVMPEHFHWLVSEPEVGNPSTVMQVVKQRFAQALGTAVWQERFWRFQRLEPEERGREAAVHASEPGEARIDRRAGPMALE